MALEDLYHTLLSWVSLDYQYYLVRMARFQGDISETLSLTLELWYKDDKSLASLLIPTSGYSFFDSATRTMALSFGIFANNHIHPMNIRHWTGHERYPSDGLFYSKKKKI